VLALATYLVESAGPKKGYGERSCLWGLQRPPIDGSKTVLHVKNWTSTEASVSTLAASLLPSLLPFLITNARDSVVVNLANRVRSNLPEDFDAFLRLLVKHGMTIHFNGTPLAGSKREEAQQKKLEKENAPSRNKNAFMHYSAANRAAVVAELPVGSAASAAAIELGKGWKAIAASEGDEHAKFVALAAADKERYDAEMSVYSTEKEATAETAPAMLVYNEVTIDAKTAPNAEAFPMLGQFVSCLLPVGHVKSTQSKDVLFFETFKSSEKWLKIAKKHK
jgi:hypothetical protein